MGTASPTTREVSHSSSSITMATIRQNYSEECEALVNKYVNTKLYHSYVYLYMSSYFHRDDQTWAGFTNFFWKASEEEHRHAAALMEYQTKRGGRVVLQNITKPTVMEWGTALEAMAAVFDMEKAATQCLVTLETLATTKADFHLATFIQENFLRKQVADIKRIGDFLTKMKRVGTGLGVHMVDRDLTAFINTRIAHTEVRIGNCTVEEDVSTIGNYGGNYLANIFTEKLWL